MGISDNLLETIQDQNTFLTNLVQRSKLQAPFADFVAPPFRVRLEAGKYVRYTDDIYRVYENKIIGRQEAREIQWDVEEETYACEEYGLSKFVSDKSKEQSIAPINLEAEAAMRVKEYQAKARAYRVSQISHSAAIVTQTLDLNGSWATAAGTPVSDILNAMATVEAAVGVIPNRILVPTQVALNMLQTTEWKTYFVNAGNYNFVQNGAFSILGGLKQMGLEPLVTGARGLSTYKCTASDPTSESLLSDSVLLFYCEPNPSTDCLSFMYSPYVYMDVVTRTRVPRRRGVFIDIYEDIDELLIEANCGYLFTDAI